MSDTAHPNWAKIIQEKNLLGLKPWQTKDVWTRFQEGDRSPQIVAEVAALYVRVCETKQERYATLKNQHVNDIWERYKELGFPRHRVQWWAGKAVKASMVHPIVEAEYPTERYEEVLRDLGVDPESIYNKTLTFIEKSRETR